MKLKIREVEGDGNCLLRAVGFHLKIHHTILRNLLVQELKANREHYKTFLTGLQIDGQELEDIDLYIFNISRDGYWCGESEIAALSNALKTRIHLHIQNSPEFVQTYGEENWVAEIHIIHVRDSHYDALEFVENDNDSSEEETSNNSPPPCRLKPRMMKIPGIYRSDMTGMCQECTSMSEHFCRHCDSALCPNCMLFHNCR